MRTIIISAAALVLSCTTAMAQSRYHNYHQQYRRVERYPVLPRTAAVIPYGNYNYRYSDGYFYRPFGATFRIVVPPVGIYIDVLPRGYRTVHYPGGLCYYYNGTYYQNYNNRYQVIDAPVGARVPGLLENAKTVVVNNQKLYEMNGTYYKEEISNNGDITYKVVGKSSEANIEKDVATLQVGQTIDQLPEGSKTIVINGKKLYVTPKNEYFEEVGQGESLSYKMVGNEVK